jgi:sigma-B regulation protein RsbU (phosphoserine phosphatase)
MATAESPVEVNEWGTSFKVPDSAFIGLSLLGLAVATVLSVKIQPSELAVSAWSPNAGIALGLGICYRRRYAWILALAVAAVTLPVLLWAGRPVLLAIALALCTAIEMWVGTLLLRGRRDRLPTLSSPKDLGTFLGIVVAASVLFALIASGVSFALSDPAAWGRLVTSAPKHVAGMVLLTPLFMGVPGRRQPAGYAESVAHAGAALAVAAAVFVVNDALPLAFLPFLPLTVAALRISTRQLSLVMLGIAIISSGASAAGMGPFAFDRLGAATGVIVLQVFQLSMVMVFLALSLVVGSERETSSRLYESQELFGKSFNSSVAGQLMVIRGSTRWTVERANPAGQDLLPGIREGVTTLETLLGDDATARLSEVADSLVDGNARFTMTLADGRSLNVSIAVIADQPDGTLFALHFHDVTESERLRQLEQAELQRAVEVQRALLPGKLPDTPGWTFGTSNSPARQVGGDFYDVRVREPSIVLSLGDVMGKGMDAGMLAAATRTALRCQDPATTPSAVVTSAADILAGDLRRISAFVTLAYVLVDTDSGDFRFADAGHGLHYVIRTSSGRVERLSSDDMPVGLGNQWRELSDRLAPGDMILLVSDGVLDLWGGSLEGLHDAISLCANSNGTGPQAVVDYLCANAGDLLDGDDVTALALRRAG